VSAELIAAELLNVAGVTALVGSRRAFAQLPDNTALPALVYDVIDDVPILPINASAGPQLMRSRVQVTAIAATLAECASIQAAVLAAMNLKSATYAGKVLSGSYEDIAGPRQRDAEAGCWLSPKDFIFVWYR
jgi:hypothetical protein